MDPPFPTKGGKEEAAATAAKNPVSWAGVVGRGAEEGVSPSHTGRTSPPPIRGGNNGPVSEAHRQGQKRSKAETPSPGPKGPRRGGKRWPTLTETAVVAVNPIPGGKLTGVELIREARQTLSLEEMEVPPLEIKRSKMGGYLLGIRGQGADAKADRLAASLKGLPGASKVAVTRPKRRRDIRVSGFEAGITPAEVVQAVAAAGGCPADEMKPGAIGCLPTGMGTLWMRCPAEAATRVAANGGVRVGWAWATVVVLSPRPERCFRCLERGHLKMHCTSAVDRSDRCYRCGRPGHAAAGCRERTPHCPLCGDIEGLDCGHILGGRGCTTAPPPETTIGRQQRG